MFKYNHAMYNKDVGCFSSLQESLKKTTKKTEHTQHNLENPLVIIPLVESVATETSVMWDKKDLCVFFPEIQRVQKVKDHS